MKTKIFKFITTLVVLMFCIYSCKKSEIVDSSAIQQVSFSFEQKDIKSLKSKEDAKFIVVSIENASGVSIYETTKLELYNFNGRFISQSLPLNVSDASYRLKAFLVLDVNGNIIYATPLEGSTFANLVNNPLPLEFMINKDQVTKVASEVLPLLDGSVPEDFGYVSFDFTIIEDFEFYTGVKILDPETSNWELTPARIKVFGMPDSILLTDDKIENQIEAITTKDGYNNYLILAGKVGYVSQDTLLTNAQLKACSYRPLIFSLNKSEIGSVTGTGGYTYKTLTYGSQTWMIEDLRTTTYSDGTPIMLREPPDLDISNEIMPKYYWPIYLHNWVYGDYWYSTAYTWFTAMDERGICPTGWHIPSNEDWEILIDFLKVETDPRFGTFDHEVVSEERLLETGFISFIGWQDKYTAPIMLRWWSSTGAGNYASIYYIFHDHDSQVTTILEELPYIDAISGVFVRCVKD